MEQQEKIAVLIPCYNEEATISTVIADFRRELPEAEIYVYDNNSTDTTYELAVACGAIVKKEPRQGKGNVIRQMFFDIDADYYLMVDGDDTYPAEAVHGLLDKLRSGEADMVIGDRLSNGTYFDENKRPFHDFGNNLVKNTITRLYKTKIRDVMVGRVAQQITVIKSAPASVTFLATVPPASAHFVSATIVFLGNMLRIQLMALRPSCRHKMVPISIISTISPT